MAWLLDTNAWIYHLKNRGGSIEQRLNRASPSEILLCSVVKAELWHGAQTYERRERRLAALQNLFQPLVSLPHAITPPSGMSWSLAARSSGRTI